MDYTPKPTEPKKLPVTYALVNDITGNAPIKSGTQVLKDSKGHSFKVPYPPKSKCKQCLGRGYVGFDLKSKCILLCKKCYPKL